MKHPLTLTYLPQLNRPKMDIEKLELAAVVILYNPTEIHLTNIATYYNQVQQLMIFDNSENPIPGLKDKFCDWKNTTYYHDGHNDGIAKRLNQACEIAIKNDATWLLSMDQDSYFPNNTAELFFNSFKTYPNRDNVAMFGPNYDKKKQLADHTTVAVETDGLITSGMLLNLNLYKKIGPFEENLFIDSVDHEYCVRTQMAGHPMVCFQHITLHHQVGTLVKRASIKSLYLIKKEKSIHSPLRCYYMYRNMLYLEDKYKEINPAFSKIIRSYVAPYMTKCYLYGRNNKKLSQYIKAAKADFKNGKMGKYIGHL